ncbi:DUF6400 family protein [Streptomyces sp. NBC_00638]|uniref:DUF6400 family protein n=1 Tax=unclassified Streptomyces TaxID=2593676 RepID=UPI00224F26FF|nr:DUF6400 family protein [Streptomyces sp. NBC_00638]MCX5008146.1 DUF6400 family protein [Streptomyces sp. NBC_00638]
MAPQNPPLTDGPGEADGPRPADAGRPDAPALVDFTIDLTAQEVLRQAQFLSALGSDWDPMEALRGEEAAYALLYSGLDDEQQRVYDDLVASGVLPRRGDGSAAA